MPITTTLVDVVKLLLEKERDALHVALPCKVVRFTAATTTKGALVDVAPSVRHRYTDADGVEAFEDYPTIVAVPLFFPRSKDFALTFPIAEGDRCTLHFADTNLAEWREKGSGAESADVDRHGFGGAYATLGGYPDAEPWNPAGPAGAGPCLEHLTGARLQVTATRVECGRTAPLPLPTLASVNAAIAALNVAVAAIAAHVTAMPTGALPPTPLAPPSAAPLAVGTTKLASE